MLSNFIILFLSGPPSIIPSPPSGSPADLASGAISFFSLWLGRIGGIVAFSGAIKFALSIKSDDTREQLQAVLIMVSGFMIAAAVRNLNVFNIPNTYTAASAQAEFRSITTFIGDWARRVGALGMLLGAITFGLSIKDNNAGGKVSGLKTLSAGAIAVSVSAILPLFV